MKRPAEIPKMLSNVSKTFFLFFGVVNLISVNLETRFLPDMADVLFHMSNVFLPETSDMGSKMSDIISTHF